MKLSFWKADWFPGLLVALPFLNAKMAGLLAAAQAKAT